MIPRELRQVLAELELLSHGSTQSWNKTAPPAERDTSPAGESFPPHESFEIDYDCAWTDTRKAEVIHEAREYLDRWKRGRRVEAKPEPPQERVLRILKEGEGFTPNEVARVFNTNVGEIIRIREKAELDPSNGEKWAKDEDPLEQARRMASQGFSIRRIAVYQGVQASTVSRRLKKAA